MTRQLSVQRTTIEGRRVLENRLLDVRRLSLELARRSAPRT